MAYENLQLIVLLLVIIILILLMLLLFRKQLLKLGPSTKPGEKVIDWSPDRISKYNQKLLDRLKLRQVEGQSPDLVPMETIERVADVHAVEIWGSDISRGEPIQIIDQEDEPVLYAVPFLISGEDIPGSGGLVKLFSRIQKIYLKQKELTGKASNRQSLSTELKTELKKYGTVFVSARKKDFPVTRVSHSLHPYFYRAEEALMRLGLEDAKLEHIRFIAPCHEFFEFKRGDRTHRLHVNLLMSEAQILNKGAQFRSEAETDELPPETTRAHNKQVELSWQAYLDIQTHPHQLMIQRGDDLPQPLPWPPGVLEYRIRNWERIPPILWTAWCEPTSASMVFAFWDHYVPVPGIGTNVGYDRIVDYWMDHPSNDNNVPDILDPIAAGPNIDVANVLKGYSNWTVTKVDGTPQNNYALSALQNELHANRPLVWQIFGPIDHATCAFGYRTMFAPAQTYVILYNTWDENEHEWLYNAYAGSPLTRVEVDRYVPSGKELYRYLIIKKPYGEETFHVGVWNEIRFAVHPLTDITKARIEYSLDGGQSWHSMVEILVQPGWNSWWWRPTTHTNKARVRIKGMNDNRDYLGGHGSFRNFKIEY